MPFGKKCINCGFLGYQYSSPEGGALVECEPQQRDEIKNAMPAAPADQKILGDRYRALLCLAHKWYPWRPYIDATPPIPFDVLSKSITQPRQCPDFTKYHAGYSPEEHKELKRDADTRHALLIASLSGAAIGAASAILAQLLYVYLTTPH